jgi:beta-aspartyl-peptidase (threonine type)
MTPQLEAAYLLALNEALDAGYTILQKGESAEAAVLAAVVNLENNILFNAGRGSVFTARGGHEMDAAIMCGHNLAAGAVAGVYYVRNPALLAAEVMNHSEHLMLTGEGALEFALTRGLAIESPGYFYAGFRHEQWKALRDTQQYALDHNVQVAETLMKDKKFGTVGAVACDVHGNLAAATSTGGMTNKRYNRIGDSPIIGAGTYANNRTCAVSCTGHGEIFMKAVAAYDVSCLIEYKGYSLQQAADEVVMKKLVSLKGEGGLVAVDNQGNIAMPFNSAGMYRASAHSFGHRMAAIYRVF